MSCPTFPAWPVRYADSLATPRGWSPTTEPAVSAECAFRNDRLEIDMKIGGIFRCPGQRDELIDFALRLDVYLIDGHTCAGIGDVVIEASVDAEGMVATGMRSRGGRKAFDENYGRRKRSGSSQ